MVAKTPAQLKVDMPSGTPGGTTIADMHNFIDLVDNRTTFSVREFGAIGTDNAANAAADTAAFVAATAAAAAASSEGTGAVYIPSGTYYITPNTWAIPGKTKVFGDGYGTRIKKAGAGWLLDASGDTWFGNNPAQNRNSYCILRDLYFDGQNNTDCILRAYYTSELLVDKCRFAFNSGPAFEGVEFWDSRFQNCFFDWCGSSTLPALRLRNNASATSTDFGYSPDSTNAISFYGCRWESFKNGAIWIERGPFVDPSPVSQIFFTNCKCETSFINGSIIKFDSAANATNIHIDTMFIATNSFNTGYSTAIDVIDWNVNNSCSIRNLWVVNASSTLVRTVVKANLSFNNNTLENIFISGSKPTVGVVETNSTSEPKLLGYVGGNTNSMNATVNSKGTGLSRAITAMRPATLLDNGIMFTNSTAGDLVVELQNNASPGWTCQALQLSAAGTITFQQTSTATDTTNGTSFRGATFVFQNGTDHRRTGGLYAMVDVRCISNNAASTAAVYHIRGLTAAAAGT